MHCKYCMSVSYHDQLPEILSHLSYVAQREITKSGWFEISPHSAARLYSYIDTLENVVCAEYDYSPKFSLEKLIERIEDKFKV